MHALDGCPTAALAYKQHAIEEMMRLSNIDDTDQAFDTVGRWEARWWMLADIRLAVGTGPAPARIGTLPPLGELPAVPAMGFY